MPFLYGCATLALWASAFVFGSHAYMVSVGRTAVDARTPSALMLCGLTFLAGHIIGLCLQRLRPAQYPPLKSQHWAMSVAFASLITIGATHLGPHMSITVIREEVPPLFTPMYLALAFTLPLWLRVTSRRWSTPFQFLLLSLGATALDGALFFLTPSMSFTLGIIAILLQLANHRRGISLSAPIVLCALTVLMLLTYATATGLNPLHAQPSWSWCVATALLALAAAWKRPSAQEWRTLLAAPVLIASLVALCGVALGIYLAIEVHPSAALNSRQFLFRQHPNFLAPFYAVHALIALALAVSRSGKSRLWILAVALLLTATFMTDSNTGMAALALGICSFAALAALRLFTPKMRRRVLASMLIGGSLALIAWNTILPANDTFSWLSNRIGRFQKSVEYRADAWTNSVQIISAHPLTGVGPKTFVSVSRFKPGSRFFNEPESPHPHNVFLYVAQAGGLPTVAVYVIWMLLLAGGLWKRLTASSHQAPEEPSPLIAVGLLSAFITLLACNMLDLGLALWTVVPAPIFLWTALIATPEVKNKTWRPGPAFITGSALLVALIHFGLSPIRAETSVERAQLLFFDAGQTSRQELKEDAIDALRHAISLDATVPRAHHLLSRSIEDTNQGFIESRQILQSLIDLAPHYGPSHTHLAEFYQRMGMYPEAAEEYDLSIKDGHGGLHQTQDRAALITCLAQSGERDAAFDALIEALRLDISVIHFLPWVEDKNKDRFLSIKSDPPQPPLSLADSAEIIYAQHQHENAKGMTVGWNRWVMTARAFREAGRDDRALAVLQYIESNVSTDEVERHSTLLERGRIARDQGNTDLAAHEFQQAYELTGNAHYLQLISEMNLETQRVQEKKISLEQSLENLGGMILDNPMSYELTFVTESNQALVRGDPARAAYLLSRTLLFHDDPLERAKRLIDISGKFADAALWDACLVSLTEALSQMHAKAYPAHMLAIDETQTLPGKVARLMCRAWQAQGKDASMRQDAAWKLDHYFSSRQSPSLFRLQLHIENGRIDALLREAQLLLLSDPHHQPARWAEISALEAFGHFEKAAIKTRELTMLHGDQQAMDQAWRQLVSSGEFENPDHWFRAGLTQLLRGYYAESADLFRQGRGLVEDDNSLGARFASWQSRALALSGRREAAARAMQEAIALDEMPLIRQLQLDALR